MRNKAYLGLIEQLIMLLVFALTAAVCLQAFAWANSYSSRMEAVDSAVIIAQSAAEMIRSDDGDTELALANAAKQLGGKYENGMLTVCYNKDLNVSEANCTYRLSASELDCETNGLCKIEILITSENRTDTLFRLETARQEEVTADE